MVKQARSGIENLTPDQVSEELSNNNATLIDLRESEELIQSGRIAGASHAPRGMVEFCADPTTPYYRPEFEKQKVDIPLRRRRALRINDCNAQRNGV